MSSSYPYIGPPEIAIRVRSAPTGVRIDQPDDVLQWIRQTRQEPDRVGNLTATFVIDESGNLRIADRRSEHVACAGGRAVLSAGEMTFQVLGKTVEVSQVSNQSTGYCPEPESWPAVQGALGKAGISPPDGFDPVFQFRRCVQCGAKNLIKDDIFECGVCSAPLPVDWNFHLTPDPKAGSFR